MRIGRESRLNAALGSQRGESRCVLTRRVGEGRHDRAQSRDIVETARDLGACVLGRHLIEMGVAPGVGTDGHEAFILDLTESRPGHHKQCRIEQKAPHLAVDAR